MVNFLPAPPEFESSRFVADQTQYLWGKRQRQNEERAAMAIRDAVYGMQTIIQEFCPIQGIGNHQGRHARTIHTFTGCRRYMR